MSTTDDIQLTPAELEYEIHRMKLWSDVCVATAAAINCTDTSTAGRYADAALKDFDRQFKDRFLRLRNDAGFLPRSLNDEIYD